MTTVDLHIHTSASEDGELKPPEVMALVVEAGLKAIAFADHDTTEAIPEGARLAGEAKVDFLPAVEITATHGSEDVHILGYLIEPDDDALQRALARTRAGRVEQARERVAVLKRLGFEIDFDRVLEVAQGRPPTSAILMAVLKENFARKRDEKLVPYIEGDKSGSAALNFFLDYHAPGRPAYVSMEMLEAARAIELVRNAGGVSVMAHPGRSTFAVVTDLATRGLDGVEVYTSNHTPGEEAFFAKFADDRGLIQTAGSDFHGPGRKKARVGVLSEGTTAMVDALREKKQSR